MNLTIKMKWVEVDGNKKKYEIVQSLRANVNGRDEEKESEKSFSNFYEHAGHKR